eukprot:TRINITY_DN4716_c0_g1_i1.p1 TRINITY_DN4716_c0_g1~~TRINITY_DN4716_c0_g1_i1.p1  ORF type:complete len:321 (+),score=90.47 TRINITY_DN4716_c0_g1_i1:55-1017(+)
MVEATQLEDLQDWVCDQGKIISYRWLAAQFEMSANQAKQLLEVFYQKFKKSISASYFVSGFQTADDGEKRHVIRVVPDNQLEAWKANLVEVLSSHVFAVHRAPVVSSDVLAAPLRDVSFRWADVGCGIQCAAAKVPVAKRASAVAASAPTVAKTESAPTKNTSAPAAAQPSTAKSVPKAADSFFKQTPKPSAAAPEEPAKPKQETKPEPKKTASSFFQRSQSAIAQPAAAPAPAVTPAPAATVSKQPSKSAPAPAAVTEAKASPKRTAVASVVDDDDDEEITSRRRRRKTMISDGTCRCCCCCWKYVVDLVGVCVFVQMT